MELGVGESVFVESGETFEVCHGEQQDQWWFQRPGKMSEDAELGCLVCHDGGTKENLGADSQGGCDGNGHCMLSALGSDKTDQRRGSVEGEHLDGCC